MASSEISPHSNGSLTLPLTQVNGAGKETAADLCKLANDLARGLPGEVRQLTVRSGDREVQIEWRTAATTIELAAIDTVNQNRAPAAGPPPGSVASGSWTPDGADGAAAGATGQAGAVAVRAPLVGTYFAAPSPDADPFVRVGDVVEAGATVAIIEAMKMMNPILASHGGVVVDVLVDNAEPVEYDQILLLITPTDTANPPPFDAAARDRR